MLYGMTQIAVQVWVWARCDVYDDPETFNLFVSQLVPFALRFAAHTSQGLGNSYNADSFTVFDDIWH